MTTKYLADVNFWLALAFDFHAGHAAATDWFETQNDEAVSFCRMTQQGFLRLASDRRVFPDDALTLVEAWDQYDQLAADPRVGQFAAEPSGVEADWRAYTARSKFSPKVWNDAYLAAFARISGLEIVTFDNGFRQYDGLAFVVLA